MGKQLGAIEKFLDSELPERAMDADVMKRCCENYRYQFSQFKVVYEYVKAGKSLANSDGFRASQTFSPVEYKSLDIYGKAFSDRVTGAGREANV